MNIKIAMHTLIASGTIREMIVVMPDVSNRYLGSHYANSAVETKVLPLFSTALALE